MEGTGVGLQGGGDYGESSQANKGPQGVEALLSDVGSNDARNKIGGGVEKGGVSRAHHEDNVVNPSNSSRSQDGDDNSDRCCDRSALNLLTNVCGGIVLFAKGTPSADIPQPLTCKTHIGHSPLHREQSEEEGNTVRLPSTLVVDGGENVSGLEAGQD